MFTAEQATMSPIERFQAKMPRLLEDFADHENARLVLGRDKLPSITAHTRAGVRRFQVRRVPWATIKTTMFLLDAVNPAGADQRSIYRLYLNFVACNSDESRELYDSDEMLCLFIVDIIMQGIKASSAETYMCSILKIAKRSNHKIAGPLIHDLRKMLHMLRLDDEVDHAVDITEEIALELLRSLKAEAQAVCAMLMITGARVADLLHIEAKDVKWMREYVTVHFKCTKNRKNPNKVFTANYKLDFLDMEICSASLMAVLKAAQAPKEKVFRMTAEDFNAQVKLVWKPEWGAKVATSYSFRRLAIQRFVKQSMVEEDGVWVVKWARAMALTGHLRLETLRTRYVEVDFQTLEGAEMPAPPEKRRRNVHRPPVGLAGCAPPLLPRGANVEADDRIRGSSYLPVDWDNQFDS